MTNKEEFEHMQRSPILTDARLEVLKRPRVVVDVAEAVEGSFPHRPQVILCVVPGGVSVTGLQHLPLQQKGKNKAREGGEKV